MTADLEAAQGWAQVFGKPPRMNPAQAHPTSCSFASQSLQGKSFVLVSLDRAGGSARPQQRRSPLSRTALGASVRKPSRRRGERTPNKRHLPRRELVAQLASVISDEPFSGDWISVRPVSSVG